MRLSIGVVAAFLSVIPCAWADVTITVFRGSATTTLGPFSSGSNVTVTLDTNITKVWVSASSSTDDLGTLTFDGTPPSDFQLLVRATDVFPSDPRFGLTPPIRDWAGMSASASTFDAITLAAAISGDLTGPVKARHVLRLQVGHDIEAPVTATGTDNWDSAGPAERAIGVIRAEHSILAGGTITSAGGIFRIDVGAESQPEQGIAADINAPDGKIDNIYCGWSLEGNVTAKHGIDSIEAGAITGDVTANLENDQVVPAHFDDGRIVRIELFDYGLGEPESATIEGRVRANNLGTYVHMPDPTDDFLVGLVKAFAVHQPMRFDATVYGIVLVGGEIDTPGEAPSIMINGSLHGNILCEGSVESIEICGDVMTLGALPIGSAMASIESIGSIGSIQVRGRLGQSVCDSAAAIHAPYVGEIALGQMAGYIDGAPQHILITTGSTPAPVARKA